MYFCLQNCEKRFKKFHGKMQEIKPSDIPVEQNGRTFCKLPALSWVLSMILMATSWPVGKCRANFTLAKFPLPIVFISRYFPMGCSMSVLRPDGRRLEEWFPWWAGLSRLSPLEKEMRRIKKFDRKRRNKGTKNYAFVLKVDNIQRFNGWLLDCW